MLIIFLLQHPIFIVARIPIFILYSLLTCCCDKGRDYPGDELFKDRIISFDYIEYEEGRLNNFVNHPVGRNELEYHRSLRFVRRQTLREREQAEQAAQPGQSYIRRQASRLGETIYAAFSQEAHKEFNCMICTCAMKPGEELAQLACHEDHVMHMACFRRWYDYNINNNQAALNLCPLCRTPVRDADVRKKIYQVEKTQPKAMVEEAFGIPELPEAENSAEKRAGAKVQAIEGNQNLPPGLILPPLAPGVSEDQPQGAAGGGEIEMPQVVAPA